MITIANKKNGYIDGEYVGRPSPLGNPFHLDRESNRDECIEKYREWLYKKIENKDEKILEELGRLHSKWITKGSLRLLCWCSPKRCHADVIKEILDSRAQQMD